MLKRLKLKTAMDDKEQLKITQLLTTLDREIRLLQQELDLLKQQKKCLMQLLLTGIVRISATSEGGENCEE